jgi:tetratricopeptide (TPR) repeat protein
MRLRLSLLAATAALAAALIAPIPARAEPGSWADPPDKLPRVARGDRIKNLDFLFEALKVAPDADSAKLVESRIWAVWLASGSDTADLLMTRAKTAADQKDLTLAIELLAAVIELRPDYVEAWNRRATIHFANKNYGASLADIRQVLAREPRHFGALSGLGVIMQEFGEEKLALEAFRRALAVNPHLQKIPDFVKALTEKVEGRDI